MKKLDFQVPFTGFCPLSFLNCFAAVYVYMEGFHGDEEYECARETEGVCTGCGHCHGSLGQLREDWYFLFGALTGRNSLFENFDRSITKPAHEDERYVDFCMKFAGYSYEKVTKDIKPALESAIDQGRPAIAVLKNWDNGPARVLIGYDGDDLLIADPKNSQNPDAAAPTYDEIHCLYVITEEGEPKYILFDGLSNMEQSLGSVVDGGTDVLGF